MSSNWTDCKLGEIVSLEYGKSLSGYRESNGNYPVYGTNGKIGNTDQFLSPIPSIIIGRKGAYRGVHFSQCPFYVIDTAFYVKPKTENIDLLFLYNFLLTQDINAMDSGSAIPSTDRHEIYDIDLLLPPLREQRAIAQMLSSLDDKIDLLHRQNKTLERMAEALWRKMFVEEADPKWKAGPLSDYVEVIDNRGKTPPFIETETNYPIIEVNALTGMERLVNYTAIKKYVSEETYNTWFRSGHPKINDTLISTVGSVGEMSMFLIDKGTIAQNVVALRATNTSPFYLYQYLRYFQNDIKEYDIGSVQPSIKVTHFVKMDLIQPDDEKLKIFDIKMHIFTDKIIANSIQISTLSRLRDTLLPKLMSGEVRVRL